MSFSCLSRLAAESRECVVGPLNNAEDGKWFEGLRGQAATFPED